MKILKNFFKKLLRYFYNVRYNKCQENFRGIQISVLYWNIAGTFNVTCFLYSDDSFLQENLTMRGKGFPFANFKEEEL